MGTDFGVEAGRGVVLVAKLLELLGHLLLPHRQMQLAIRNGHVLVAEQGRLATLPPAKAPCPLLQVQVLAVEFIRQGLDLRPAALVLLVGQGVGIGDVLGRLAQGAGAGPCLGGASVGTGDCPILCDSSGGKYQEYRHEPEYVFHGCAFRSSSPRSSEGLAASA